MNLNYTTGIPDTPNNPSNDQPGMKTNTNSISTIIQQDHHGFKDNLGGYHTIIHQDAQVTDPANIAGPPQINQVYVKSYTPDTTGGVADTQLYAETALGEISQLTGFSLGDLEDGWQWIGGVLLQWGRSGSGQVTSGSYAAGNAAGTVTFKDRVTGAIPFPNNCFIVLTTAHYTFTPPGGPGAVPNGAGVVAINRQTISNTAFDFRFNSNSSSYTGFYWLAVGN